MRLCLAPALAIVMSGCGGSGQRTAPRPIEATTVTTVAVLDTAPPPSAPSTTLAVPPTTGAPAPTTTVGTAATPPRSGLPPLLVAHQDGVEILTGDVRRSVWDGPVAAAFPDGQGGVLVGVDDAAGFRWDPELERYVMVPPEAAGILRVDADGHVDTFLPSTPDGLQRLMGVARVAGETNAIVWRTVAGPPCCDGDPDAPQREFASIRTLLVLVDVVTGEETAYGIVAGYETDLTLASFGGDVVALTVHEYAGGMGPLWWAPRSALEEVGAGTIASGAIPGLEEACDAGRCATAGAVAPCEEEETCWNVMRTPGVAPDGSAVAYVEAFEGPGSAVNPEVVVVDLPSGVERWRVPLDVAGPGGNVWAAAVDFNGETALVSLTTPIEAVLLVGESGEMARMSIEGVAVRWPD